MSTTATTEILNGEGYTLPELALLGWQVEYAVLPKELGGVLTLFHGDRAVQHLDPGWSAVIFGTTEDEESREWKTLGVFDTLKEALEAASIDNS